MVRKPSSDSFQWIGYIQMNITLRVMSKCVPTSDTLLVKAEDQT